VSYVGSYMVCSSSCMEYVANDFVVLAYVVLCVGSLYAGNELDGFWRKKYYTKLITEGQALLACARATRTVTFVHVKGHSANGGTTGRMTRSMWASQRALSLVCGLRVAVKEHTTQGSRLVESVHGEAGRE
jgi:hypothetical protein